MFLTDMIANTTAGLIKTGLNVKKTTEGIIDGASTAYKTVEEVVRNGYNLLTKYWYIPVIVGGVIVGYLLISRANPAANVAKLLSAAATAYA